MRYRGDTWIRFSCSYWCIFLYTHIRIYQVYTFWFQYPVANGNNSKLDLYHAAEFQFDWKDICAVRCVSDIDGFIYTDHHKNFYIFSFKCIYAQCKLSSLPKIGFYITKTMKLKFIEILEYSFEFFFVFFLFCT